jgi:predicted Zn-dependent peptidase
VNTILGERFTSWLNTELRIKSGLTYGARSQFDELKEAGTFVAYSFTAIPTTERAIDLALEVLDRLHAEGIDEETLRSGKNYIKGNYPRRFESPAGLAGLLTTMHYYGVDRSYIDQFSQQLEAVTPEMVKQVIAKHFPIENLQFVLAGKGSAIRDIASKYGEVTEIDINSDEYLSK